MRTIQPTQPFLWGQDRRVLPFGAYQGLIRQPLTEPWDGNNGLLSPRRLQRKAWLFLGVCNADFYGGIAICDAGYLAKLFVYVYDVKTGLLLEDGTNVPFGFAKDLDWTLESDWKLKNYHIYKKGNQLIANYSGKKFSLQLELDETPNGLSFVCPSQGKRPFHFTYKNLALPSVAEFSHNGKSKTVNTLLGSVDFSKGYPPYHTYWNWTSFMGQAEDGTPVGVNLVNGFNNNLENALWWGNEVQLLDSVRYDYAKASEKVAWKVHNADQIVLEMPQPLGARREKVNALVAKSQFIQVFGAMSGKVRRGDQWIGVQGYGVMEEHEAKW